MGRIKHLLKSRLEKERYSSSKSQEDREDDDNPVDDVDISENKETRQK